MALGYLDDSKLYAIASAIRAKTGDSATMTVDDMPDEIGSISTGAQVEPLSVTENGTYSAPTGYAYSPVTVDVAGGGGGEWEPVGDGKTRFWVKGDMPINLLTTGHYAGRPITVDWGDGSPVEEVTTSDSAVRFSHTYSTNGIYCILLGGSGLIFGGGTGVTAFETYGSAGRVNQATLLAVELGSNCDKANANAFQNCTALEAAFLNCQRVEGNAFYQCYSLKTVKLFSRVSYIGAAAFDYCHILESVDIPDSITNVNNQAFSDCVNLKSAKLPNVLTQIAASLFSGCLAIENLTIPSTVTYISQYAFYRCVRLKYIRMLSTTPPTIQNSNAFTEVTANIYVPAESVDAYKVATGWSDMAARIMADPDE